MVVCPKRVVVLPKDIPENVRENVYGHLIEEMMRVLGLEIVRTTYADRTTYMVREQRVDAVVFPPCPRCGK